MSFFSITQPAKTSVINGDCFDVMDDMIKNKEQYSLVIADPPYFLSNDGLTAYKGRFANVNKGEWDKSKGLELNHEFNKEWLSRCKKLLSPRGSIWVTGTFHNIYSVGFAMQELGFHILNNITWVKPSPPPNLSCRTFTHSTETILWAKADKKTRYIFNYDDMTLENDYLQMKDVWEFKPPSMEEKSEGKHPTQKPIALFDRIVRASVRENATVLDPFLGSGTTSIACLMNNINSVGIEQDIEYCELAKKRITKFVT